MNKIIITTDNNKKINFINSIDKKKSIICFKNNIIINRLNYDNILHIEDFNNMIKFLDFQGKVNNTILIILDCIRYKTYPNSIYTKIERIISNTDNIVVINDFPFVFDYRNIYISLKFIRVIAFHYRQWYDDDFYLDNVRVNSLEYIYKEYKDYFFVDKQRIKYSIINWDHTKKEEEAYKNKKHNIIYEKKYSKIKVVTSCQGFVNRMKSKFNRLEELINDNKRYIIITNWERAINNIKNKIVFKSIYPTSYHQSQDRFIKMNVSNVIFFETIITQKIKFYDILKCYIDKELYFLKNENIGIDRLNCNQTINNLEELNNFYEKTWKNI
jgi:hypothetical protein